MRYFENDVFTYKNGELYCEEVPLKIIAEATGSPAFVYSKTGLQNRYLQLREAFLPIPVQIFYAVKANFNLSLLKVFNHLGSSFDVNSLGELHRALKAGAEGNRLLLTGVGKRIEEIEQGISAGVHMIKAESLGEIELLQHIAKERGVSVSVALRVNPNVNAETHPYISTGLAENKFGIPREEAEEIYLRHREYPNLHFSGIDMHIGSQITSSHPHAEAAAILAELYTRLQGKGVPLEHFDIGGGFGVNYSPGEEISPESFAQELIPVLQHINGRIYLEPGRSLVANAGVLLVQVLYRKRNGAKQFVIVDGAMTDLLRPSIYQAYHHIQPVTITGTAEITCDIVGPVCESGDFLAKDRVIDDVQTGELLSVMSAGAYGMVMSSNYNARPKAAEIMVSGNQFRFVRGRETYSHMLYDEESLLSEL